jgi:iron complex outermembrane receptor protein
MQRSAALVQPTFLLFLHCTGGKNAQPAADSGPYGLLNASFNWDRIDGTPLNLQLYGTNLTDRTYRISNSNVWELLGFQSSIYGEPRMVGLQMGYSWGG